MSKPDIEIVKVNKFQMLQHTLKELGIGYMLEATNTGREMLSIWDDAENEVVFVFGKHGDEITDLIYWEAWKA